MATRRMSGCATCNGGATVKPLASLSIRCLTKVDRRQEGGTQKDVVLEYVFKASVKKVEDQPQAKAKEVGNVANWPSWRRRI